MRLRRDVYLKVSSLSRNTIASSEVAIDSNLEKVGGEFDASGCFEVKVLMSWGILSWAMEM